MESVYYLRTDKKCPDYQDVWSVYMIKLHYLGLQLSVWIIQVSLYQVAGFTVIENFVPQIFLVIVYVKKQT